MNWFLYDRGLNHERIKCDRTFTPIPLISNWFRVWMPFVRVGRKTDLLLSCASLFVYFVLVDQILSLKS